MYTKPIPALVSYFPPILGPHPHIRDNLGQLQMHFSQSESLEFLLKFNPFTFIAFTDISDILGVIYTIVVCMFHLMSSPFAEIHL